MVKVWRGEEFVMKRLRGFEASDAQRANSCDSKNSMSSSK
jgi:hypothetical protein